MTVEQRIDAMVKLGEHLLKPKEEYLQAVMQQTYIENQWFTLENQADAIESIATNFLNRSVLENCCATYPVLISDARKVGLVLSDNTPLAGFHDLLCVFLAGHHAQIKLAEKDKYLLPYLFSVLKEIDPATTPCFQIVERLSEFDAIIATGNNNSVRYFETYFGKYPNIIRQNRKSVAVLDGTEQSEELIALGKDIFQYFGLGHRNVAKIYVPKSYQFNELLEALHEYRKIVLNTKYKNNFDYHYTLCIINRAKYMANGCIILKENESIISPIANLHYEYYEDLETLNQKLHTKASEIQFTVSKLNLNATKVIPFGQSQSPKLTDYLEGIDTMDFLLNL